MKLNNRLDGHIVQGHVDTTGTCISRNDKEGSVEFTFEFNEVFAPLIIEKGSICVNGVSLTAFAVNKTNFTVAIIPYTLLHTNFNSLSINNLVNLEFDVLGKYVARIMSLKTQ
jgi:riboflavin synthase